jgi:hypothetical protein
VPDVLRGAPGGKAGGALIAAFAAAMARGYGVLAH